MLDALDTRTALRSKLDGRVSLFLDQIEFVGCDGLEITEEIELSIAAQACLLVLGREESLARQGLLHGKPHVLHISGIEYLVCVVQFAEGVVEEHEVFSCFWIKRLLP